MNQCVDMVAMGKLFHQPGLVLPDSLLDVVGYADIQRAGLVGHDVDIVGLAHGHAVIIDYATALVMSSGAIAKSRPCPERALLCYLERGRPPFVMSSEAPAKSRHLATKAKGSHVQADFSTPARR